MNAHIKELEKSQIISLEIQFKLLDKQEQANPKSKRRKKIIKIRTEINESETKKTNIMSQRNKQLIL
jgi:signal recognition particle subunit SEC65